MGRAVWARVTRAESAREGTVAVPGHFLPVDERRMAKRLCSEFGEGDKAHFQVGDCGEGSDRGTVRSVICRVHEYARMWNYVEGVRPLVEDEVEEEEGGGGGIG
jgi:hypothetical protein